MSVNMHRLSFQAVLIVAAVILLGIGPVCLWSSRPRQAVEAMVFAGMICLCMGIISLVPLVKAARHHPDWLGQAWLAGTVIRLLLTLIGAILVYFAVIEPRQIKVYTSWIVCFYLILLVWETLTATKMVKMFYKIPSSDEKKTQ